MPIVRTTNEPWREISVTDLEYLTLLRQGLIYTGEPVQPPPAFTDRQYEELANPDGEAAKRILDAIGESEVVDAATDGAVARLQPTIDGLVDDVANALSTVEDRADSLEAYVNTEVTAIKPSDGVKFNGSSRIFPVGQGELALRPEYWGAVGNGIADDTAAIQSMFAFASTNRARRWVCRFTGNYRITDTLLVDVYTTSAQGPAQITSAINDSAKYMVRTYSTDPAQEGSPVRQRVIYWDGIVLYGDNQTGGFDITGANGSDKPAHVTFRNCTFARHGVAVHFGRNAYMVGFFACNISLSRVGVWHEDAANSGERLEFFGCDITGHGVAVRISSGQAMHFISCSFSYVLRRIADITTGQAFFSECHFEFNAPYAAFFNLTGSGAYVCTDNSRWLIRDPSPSVSSGLVFSENSATIGWADNPRDRWGEGDPITFVGLTGATGLSGSTVYYMRNVTNSGFQISATPTGAIISWTGAGSASGLLADPSAPIFSLGNISANATVRDGHVHGSASGVKTWCDGVGAQSFEIEGTGTFGSTPLRMRTRPGGDLRDPAFRTAGTILDDWEAVGPITLGTSTDVMQGVNSLLVTRTGAGTARVDLWIPIPSMARFLWYFNYKASSAITINQGAYFVTARRVSGAGIPALGSTLWSSNMAFDTAWKTYAQNGQNDRRSPRWAKFLLVRFDLSNLPVGGTMQIDYPEASFL